ncbi:MAG: pirin family protein [Saprospiraceae bacterium]
MNIKEVQSIYNPPSHHMVGDGFRVHNFIPGISEMSMERMDPIIMMDYNSKFLFSPTSHPRGVGVHPHRGFETITVAYHGRIAHHDSKGNSGIIQEGEVQWMTAASGILHKEYHEEEFSKQGGYFQMVQLWLNLPAQYKMSEPKYQNITRDKIAKFVLNNNQGIIEIIAGEFEGLKGPASTFTTVNLMNANLKQDGICKFSFPAHYNTCLLIIEGSIKVNENKLVNQDQFVLFKNTGEEFTIQANEKSIVLILSAEPIQEPIAAHGPFVMNSREELVQAFNDFQNGKFGELE